MKLFEKISHWVKENAPSTEALTENKYIALGYDHFASLPIKQQKLLIKVLVSLWLFLLVSVLFYLYSNLYHYSNASTQVSQMIEMIEDYRRSRQDQSGEIAFLERNNRLAAQGAFRSHLINQAKLSSISPRMVEVKEEGGITELEDGEESNLASIRMKQASVKLQRVNLNQLKNFLENIEYGKNNLSITSISIENDEKLRGYLNVSLAVVAYLFQSHTEEP